MTRYGFLSTFPPTRCGLATFTEALADALTSRSGSTADVVRVLDQPEVCPPGDVADRVRVRAELVPGDTGSAARAVAALDACDVAIVQHEYGIYGGADGDEILDLLAAVRSPIVVVLHTVLAAPTRRQRDVLIAVCTAATIVVVMTHNAGDILTEHYGVDEARVRMIPHGVATFAATPEPHARKRVVTWGLISPGKGIEWGIRAMAELGDLHPAVEYIVAGQTHPKVLAHAGESYRMMLTDLVDRLGLEGDVRLDGRYLDAPDLARLVASADVVLLPYDSRDQATSGVLAEAVAAGVPVVATGFPHARELLADGAGIVVEHEDPSAIATALRKILTAEAVAEHMREVALRSADETSWAAVADQYRELTATLLAARAA